MTRAFAWLAARIAALRAWSATHGPLAKVLGWVAVVALSILAGMALLGVLLLVARDKVEGKDAPATADKIKKEAKDAHDSEAARVAALPADAVVDALPNAGEVRGVRDGAIERGKARIADLLNRYRVGADGRGDPGGGGPDGNGGG